MAGGVPSSSDGGSGAGDGKVAGKKKAKAQTQTQSQSQSKTNCVVCRQTCNKVASNRAGGVQCCICDSWWHPKCAHLTQDMFDMITRWTDTGLDSPWKCQTCDRAMAKYTKLANVLTTKVEANVKVLSEHSVRMDRIEDREKVRDSKLDTQQQEIARLREELTKLGDSGGPSVMRELDERNGKENNLVVHRVEESGEGEAKRRIEHDKMVVQQILNVIGVELGVEKDIKFVRRLGARVSDGEKRDPRPLLLGLVHRHSSELILENCWKLGESSNEAYRAMSVVRDLTLRQRAGERELYKEAAMKNLARSLEQQEENMVFKVVGRRGSKREILAPLRPGEVINSAGEVIWASEEEGTSGGTVGGRGRTGPAAATYPNCVPVGTPGGFRGMSPGTPLGQTMGQSTARGRRGGWRGRGGGVSPGSRAQLQKELDRCAGTGGTAAGRGGSVRQREVSRSPADMRCPPEKRADVRDSPVRDMKEGSISLIDFEEEVVGEVVTSKGGVVYDEDGEVVDDAQAVY